jgi:hypothetical protein
MAGRPVTNSSPAIELISPTTLGYLTQLGHGRREAGVTSHPLDDHITPVLRMRRHAAARTLLPHSTRVTERNTHILGNKEGRREKCYTIAMREGF